MQGEEREPEQVGLGSHDRSRPGLFDLRCNHNGSVVIDTVGRKRIEIEINTHGRERTGANGSASKRGVFNHKRHKEHLRAIEDTFFASDCGARGSGVGFRHPNTEFEAPVL